MFRFKFYVLISMFFVSFHSLEAKRFKTTKKVLEVAALFTLFCHQFWPLPAQASSLTNKCDAAHVLFDSWNAELIENHNLTIQDVFYGGTYRGTLDVYAHDWQRTDFSQLTVPTLIRLVLEICTDSGGNSWAPCFNNEREVQSFLEKVQIALRNKNLWPSN
jgi:hypothetical protein